MVSSKMEISVSDIMTRSGLSKVEEMLGGIGQEGTCQQAFQEGQRKESGYDLEDYPMNKQVA